MYAADMDNWVCHKEISTWAPTYKLHKINKNQLGARLVDYIKKSYNSGPDLQLEPSVVFFFHKVLTGPHSSRGKYFHKCSICKSMGWKVESEYF